MLSGHRDAYLVHNTTYQYVNAGVVLLHVTCTPYNDANDSDKSCFRTPSQKYTTAVVAAMSAGTKLHY